MQRFQKYDLSAAEFKPRAARFPRLAASPTPRLPRLSSQRERPATRDGPRVPMNVLEIAAAHSIPLNSLTMVPCVCTREGVMIFDDYLKKIREASRSNSYPGDVRSSGSSSVGSDGGSGKVVMIHNLDPEVIKDVNPLFTFCSAFGNVDRIKIMFNKRDTAFIQMASVSDANNIIRHCQGLDIFGKTLVIVRSKIENIHLPYTLINENNEELNLTKDFTNSPARRFSPKFEKRRSYICTPTNMLYISNLPELFSEKELKYALDGEMNKIVNMKPMNKGVTHTYLVQCMSATAAVKILMFKHLMKFKGNHVRISFTAAQISPEPELTAYEQ
jgi:hypothetical protein